MSLEGKTRTKHRIIWGVSGVVLFALLFTGLFIPTGPTLSATDAALQISPGDTAWMLTATGLVLFMTPGLAFFYGGMVRSHSIISTMLQCFICLAVVGVIWIIIGFSLAFGESAGGFIGNPWTYLWFRNVGGAPEPAYAATIPFQLFALFQLKFAAITPALTAGGYIERIRFGPFLVFIILFTLICYCPVAHWVWSVNGFLRSWGVLDYAGGTVVHINAGVAALAGAIAIGRRNVIKRGEKVEPCNVPFVILGTGMLWFGWFGFNAGSALAANQSAAQAFLNTNTASAAAMCMWLILEGVAGKKPSAVGACIGAVVGLVVITPAAGFITVGQSLFFGGFAAMVSYVAIWLLHKTKLDDGLDAFGSHGVGGMLGAILTGAFCSPTGVVYGRWEFFGYYWAAIVIVSLWSFFWTFVLLKLINLVTPLRISAQEEEYGLDTTQHGETIYDKVYFGDVEKAPSGMDAIMPLDGDYSQLEGGLVDLPQQPPTYPPYGGGFTEYNTNPTPEVTPAEVFTPTPNYYGQPSYPTYA